MPDVRVVLVGPKYEGNVGAVARSMANFDMHELYLVNPCGIGEDAYRRAKHGNFILDEAKRVDSLKEAIGGCFLVVGTSGITTKGNKNYVRVPITAKEFAERMNGYEEKIAILFGPEDTGLFQEELALCDVLVTIPSSSSYPVLNLSHAATVVMYELFGSDIPKPIPANEKEKEQIFEFFDLLLDAIDYPEHRKEGTSIMFRRMIGRSVPTRWEYNTLLGVFGDATKLIGKKK
jgi:TrmH family RNA methyltransferase